MPRLTRDKIEYMVMMVNMFARQFHLSEVEAYRYISRYQGIELMDEFYDVMHTQPFPDMVDSMAKYCARNGGYLVWFDIVYNSNIFAKLSDPEMGLYFQSPGYVYSYLETEMSKAQAEDFDF